MINEIKIPVKNGHLIAKKENDPDYSGVAIAFRTNNNMDIPIALIESKSENDKSKIDVYTYEEPHADGFTRKFTLDCEELQKSIQPESPCIDIKKIRDIVERCLQYDYSDFWRVTVSDTNRIMVMFHGEIRFSIDIEYDECFDYSKNGSNVDMAMIADILECLKNKEDELLLE